MNSDLDRQSTDTIEAATEDNKNPLARNVLAIAIAACTALAVASLATAIFSSELSTPVTIELDTADQSPLPHPLNSATGTTKVDIGLGYRLLWWSVTGARWLVAAAGLELLRRVVRSKGDPFTVANVAHLRRIAGAAVLYQLIELIRGPVDVVLTSHIGFGEIATRESLGAPLVVAALACVIAQVWASGVRLREDKELTI